MDKIENLQEKASLLKALLERYADKDSDAETLLEWLTPLFKNIENGKLIPPQKYEFNIASGQEPEFYERHKDVHSY